MTQQLTAIVQTPHHSPLARPLSARRILLAEDDAELRGLIARALRHDGYEVLEVDDGGRTLVRLASVYAPAHPREAIDLLISDIRMPACSGLRILESLRRSRWKIPAILTTDFADDRTEQQAMGLGAILFAKPFDVDDLRVAVMRLLRPRF